MLNKKYPHSNKKYPHSNKEYPHLSQFLGSWFHQDFNLDGKTTIEDIVHQYKTVTSSEEEIDKVKHDILEFIKDANNNIETQFIQTFNPDVDPKGWHMTTKEWLMKIHNLL